MGHSDSSAQFGGQCEVFGAGRRTAEFDATGRTETVAAPASPKHVAATAATWPLLLLLTFYKIFLSPFFGGACKFYPSCSNYAYEAIARHGARRGIALAAKRLLRCRPFTKGGFDPVPEGEP